MSQISAVGSYDNPFVVRTVGDFERFIKQHGADQVFPVCPYAQSAFTLEPGNISRPIDVLFMRHLNNNGKPCNHIFANRTAETACRLCAHKFGWTYFKPPQTAQDDYHSAQLHFRTDFARSIGMRSRL